MPDRRDPFGYDAAALFAHFRAAGVPVADPRHWSFEFGHDEFAVLQAVAEDLLDAMIASLGREPAQLEPHLTQARIDLDEHARKRRGPPAAEIDFTDVLSETDLAALHRAFAAFAARHGLRYGGVHSYEALDDNWEPEDLGGAAPAPPPRAAAKKKAAKKRRR